MAAARAISTLMDAVEIVKKPPSRLRPPYNPGKDEQAGGMMMADMSGKVVIVTGGAGGFGRAFTKAFLDAGAKVAALDVTEEGLASLRDEHRGVNEDRLMTEKVDIADFASCQAAVDRVAERFGGVTVLINNAGLGMGSVKENHHIELIGIDEVTPEIWNHMVGVNLTGPWNMTKASIGYLREAERARIINVTTSFFTMLRGKFQPYGPSKSGFEAMSASHSAEFEEEGIMVNVVVPGGPADTPMVPDGAGFDRADLVQPANMTYPALWLCSEEGDGMTGNRYIAGRWDKEKSIADNREATEAPIGWPDLAGDPVWPGGKPDA
jgi:NAD(P)-dependent dehydrogenase (short-subunit alcohol dehydrogenase family)